LTMSRRLTYDVCVYRGGHGVVIELILRESYAKV
jgi:hypothetical protein